MESLQTVKGKIAEANKEILGFVNAFVDDRSFVETDAFICSANELGEAPGDGVVSGFASIDDAPVCLFALNSKVMKGAIGELNAKKIVRTVNNAVRMDKPLVAVWDSSGARFGEGINVLEGYGSILRAYTLAYGDIPVISVIKGNDLGLSAYVAGLSDFVIAYTDSVIASASPLVLAAKTGKDVKAVGNAECAARSGLVTETVKNDKELRAALCRILALYSQESKFGDDPNRVCKGLKAGADARALIKEVFDKNSFLEVRAGFAPVAVTGFAALGDIRVGVVATEGKQDDGRLSADACIKISEFLNTCENVECPVVFLTDSAGTEQSADDAALIREMSNLIYRVNTLDLDMFSVVYGKAIGGAYTALVSPCEYKIAWQSAEVGAVESETAARLLYADEIKTAKDKDKAAKKLAEAYCDGNNRALVLARNGYFDNVIEPELTRSYLLAALIAHVE